MEDKKKEMLKKAEEMGKENVPAELSDDDLDQVVGGAFEGIPRVPVHKIDEDLKNKV